MAKNRFEQVDEVQEDAITLALLKIDDPTKRDEDRACGKVMVPAALSGGRMPEDRISETLPAIEAFRSAVRLANEMKLPIVVMDPDGIWQPNWGELYVPSDDEAG